MLQNLTKGKMVEWVVLLVALVALGLSIAAVAKPCSSNFGDTCNPCSCPTYGEDECPTGTKCDCSKKCMRQGYGSCMAGSESSSGSPEMVPGGEDAQTGGKKVLIGGGGSLPPSLKPFRFYYNGSSCVSTTETIAGETFPTKIDCEKAMGLIVGPGGQDSHPEHSGSKSSNLPLILGITGGVGSVLVLLALAFILIRK